MASLYRRRLGSSSDDGGGGRFCRRNYNALVMFHYQWLDYGFGVTIAGGDAARSRYGGLHPTIYNMSFAQGRGLIIFGRPLNSINLRRQ